MKKGMNAKLHPLPYPPCGILHFCTRVYYSLWNLCWDDENGTLTTSISKPWYQSAHHNFDLTDDIFSCLINQKYSETCENMLLIFSRWEFFGRTLSFLLPPINLSLFPLLPRFPFCRGGQSISRQIIIRQAPTSHIYLQRPSSLTGGGLERGKVWTRLQIMGVRKLGGGTNMIGNL